MTNAMYRVSAKALIYNECRDSILLCLEENHRWEFPGGGVEHGDTPVQTLKREIKEEMGLETTFVSEQPFFILFDTFEDTGRNFVNIFYEVEVKNLNFTKSNECIDVKYFKIGNRFTEDTYTSVLNFFNEFKIKK